MIRAAAEGTPLAAGRGGGAHGRRAGVAAWTASLVAAAGAIATASGCQPSPAVRAADAAAGGHGGSGGVGGTGGDFVSCRDDGATAFAGCVFHFADSKSYGAAERQFVSLFVVNRSAGVAARVVVEARTGAGPWEAVESTTLVPAGAVLLRLGATAGAPWDGHVDGTGVAHGLARRLRADTPVTVVLFNADALEASSPSSAATLLPPSWALGSDYRAVTWPQPSPAGLGPSDLVLPALVAVVATRDGTTVNVTGAPAGRATFALDEGDFVQVATSKAGEDLTGTRVTADADKPVLVLSGTACAALDAPAGGEVPSCDKIEEALAPISTWGRQFVAPDPKPRADACRARSGWPFATRYRVLAAEDDTALVFDAPSATAGLPPSGGDHLVSAGAWKEYAVTGPFYLSATRPVALAALVGCEPSMVLVPPVAGWLAQSVLPAPGLIFRESAVIVRKSGAALALDGAALPASSFEPAGGGFELARIELPDCGLHRLAGPPADLGGCVHRLAGSPAFALVSATDFLAGYAYAGTFAQRP